MGATQREEVHHHHRFLPLKAMVLLSPVVLLFGFPGEIFLSAQFVSSLVLEPGQGKRLDSGLKIVPKLAHPNVS